jgi:hypothetical protein
MMQQGTPLTIELVKVESELLNSSLKHHYLIADERMRNRRPSRFATLGESLRTLFSPRLALREERSV